YTDYYLPERSGDRVPRAQAACRSGLPAATIARRAVGAVDRLELLKGPPRTHRDARERRFSQMRGHLGLLAQPLIQALQQRSAPREHDPPVHDVGRELGRRAVERLLDGFDDLVQRSLHRLADLL